jgi:hopanoid biosynthesis associated protein HpnK
MSAESPPKTPAPKRLIVTADDFGADIAVNEAVEHAYTNGVLTCASLMMNAAATEDAIARARRLRGLAVGLHVTLSDGVPTSPRHRVPGLVGPDGRFHDDLARTGLRWFLNPMVRAQLAREIGAQFKAFASTGLVLDHVNVHQHLHLHPTVSALLIDIGRHFGMLAIRVPEEPQRFLMKAAPGEKLPRSRLGPVVGLLRRRAVAANLIVNDHVFGLAWSGAMTEERLLALIPHLPPGLCELYTHPATADAAAMPHAAAGYRYRDELAALTSPRVRAALEANGVSLTRFSSALSSAAPAAPA